MDSHALPVTQALHVLQVGMGYRSAADQRQAAGFGRSQGIHRHGGGGGGARGGQPGGIAEQQGLAGLHRHQQGPGGDQRALFANDVG